MNNIQWKSSASELPSDKSLVCFTTVSTDENGETCTMVHPAGLYDNEKVTCLTNKKVYEWSEVKEWDYRPL